MKRFRQVLNSITGMLALRLRALETWKLIIFKTLKCEVRNYLNPLFTLKHYSIKRKLT